MSDEEAGLIGKYAAFEGVTISDFARSAMLEKMDRLMPTSAQKKKSRDIESTMSRDFTLWRWRELNPRPM